MDQQSTTQTIEIDPSPPVEQKNPTASSTNLLDLDINDWEEIEQELKSQLQELSEHVDKSYGMMANMVSNTTELVLEISKGHFTQKMQEYISVAGAMAQCVVNAWEDAKSTKLHNENVDKLLEQKKRIARAKQGAIKKLLPRINQNEKRLEHAFMKCINKEYVINDVEGNREKNIVENIDKVTFLYRTNLYYSMVAQYLNASYSAWLKGNQKGEMERPDYYQVNVILLQKLPYEEDKDVFALEKLLQKDKSKLSGSEILMLHDQQLTSTMLLEQGLTQEQLDSVGFIASRIRLPLMPTTIKELASTNPVFDQYRQEVTRQKSSKRCSTISMVVGILLSIVGCYMVYEYFSTSVNWRTWVECAVAIIIDAIGVSIILAIANSISRHFVNEAVEVGKELQESLLDNSGYIYVEEPNTKKKCIAVTAMKDPLEI